MADDLRLAIELSVFWPSQDIPGTAGLSDIDRRLDALADIEGVDGVEVYWPVDFDDPVILKQKLDARHLAVSSVGVDIFSAAEWRHGALTSADPAVRRRAIDRCKEAVEASAVLGAHMITLWPGQDGTDYPFQADYELLWNRLVAAVREIGEYRSDVRIAVEYKVEDPRRHSVASNAGTTLLLVNDTELPNVGVTIDVGHALIARESPAAMIMLLSHYGRLMHVHLNDNYRVGDHDMIPGAVHLWETLETLAWLLKMGYQGWINFDIYSYREDPVRASRQTVQNTRDLLRIAKNLDTRTIVSLQEQGDTVGILGSLWKSVIH